MLPDVSLGTQMSILKIGLSNLAKMKFAKKSSKLNYMTSAIDESINMLARLSANFE